MSLQIETLRFTGSCWSSKYLEREAAEKGTILKHTRYPSGYL